MIQYIREIHSNSNILWVVRYYSGKEKYYFTARELPKTAKQFIRKCTFGKWYDIYTGGKYRIWNTWHWEDLLENV